MFQFHSCISRENQILQYPTGVIIHKNGSVRRLFVEIVAGVETVKLFFAQIPNDFIPKVKQSRNRPGVAQRIPEGLSPRFL